MYRNMTAVIGAALMALVLVVPAHAVLIDFDTSPDGQLAFGEVLTTQYASLGVTFSGVENGGATDTWVSTQFACGTATPNHSGNCWNNFFGNPRADILRIVFDNPVENVQWFTDSEGDPVNPGIRFEAYSASDVLLETIFVDDTNFPDFQLTAFSVSGISRIDMLQPTDGWGWALDDLSFDALLAVSEPTTLALLALGIVGIGAARRRSC